jgi:hypothetical protein
MHVAYWTTLWKAPIGGWSIVKAADDGEEHPKSIAPANKSRMAVPLVLSVQRAKPWCRLYVD